MANELKTNYKKIIELALSEDLEPFGDLSSSIFPVTKQIRAFIKAKEPGVLACIELISEICDLYATRLLIEEKSLTYKFNFKNSDSFEAGDTICQINGPAQILLGAERTMLNFLQRLCGIATYTHKLTNLIKDYPCKLLDTRKTMPGMRALEKAAFVCGGGTNHRFNLSDMVMLKENHLAVIGIDLIDAIQTMRTKLDNNTQTKNIKIEVEINKDNLKNLDLILSQKLPVDIIMLDNFSPSEAKELITKIKAWSPEPRTLSIELSGGISEDNILDYAKTDPDYISSGSVFTKANNIDLSFLISDYP